VARANGRMPINLALSGVTGSRLIDAPMTADIVADSLPLDLISRFTDMVSDVHGFAGGQVAVRGTVRRPVLTGGLVLTHGAVKLTSTGMTLEDVAGTVRMANDTVYVDSLTGRAKGDVRLRGTLAVRDWRDPAFNLFLLLRDAEVLDNDRGRLRADAGLRLSGSVARAYLSGQVNVTRGVVYAPEPTSRHVIGAGDPALFNVADTALLRDDELFPVESPLLQNLRVEVALSINRSTWLRTKDANVELFTDYPLEVRVEQSALALTGAVGTDRGEYNFMSKRFLISRGSATFVGTPDLNPTLQITGEYQVQPSNSAALNIQIVIGGTMRRPKLTLQSDAQPPRSQSELLSLLAFGRTTQSLLEPGGGSTTSLATVGAPGDLVGLGATLAVKRLTGIAVGVLAEQAETQAGKALAVDQFNITPGDVPELSGLAGPQSLSNFLNSTRIEAGKYLNPRTFVGLQTYAGNAGARIEYRTNKGWRYSAFLQPRVQLLQPTLVEQRATTFASYGAFIVREWRF
jgi:translocation and assembly module TamB